jgi:MFS family permease
MRSRLHVGPVSGYLSDRFGARPFATGGLLVTAAAFAGLMLIPVDFASWLFASLIFAAGIGQGLPRCARPGRPGPRWRAPIAP